MNGVIRLSERRFLSNKIDRICLNFGDFRLKMKMHREWKTRCIFGSGNGNKSKPAKINQQQKKEREIYGEGERGIDSGD